MPLQVVASWLDETDRTLVGCDRLPSVLAEVATRADDPVIVVLEASGAALHVVTGDSTGTVLLWYPPDYERVGSGSLHSVGDTEAAANDQWEPPLTAYYYGHHTEFPRWSVVAHQLGERATQQFCEHPTEPPPAVVWEAD